MKRSLRKKVVVMGILIITCLFSACQPTPEQGVIVNKGDGNLEDIINESATNMPVITQDAESSTSSETLNPIVEEWEDTFLSTDGITSFIVNAIIHTPDVNSYPVLSVEPSDFTPVQIKKVASAFCEGEEVYSGKDLYTKSMIEDEIVEDQQMLKKYQSQNNDGSYDFVIGEIKEKN